MKKIFLFDIVFLIAVIFSGCSTINDKAKTSEIFIMNTYVTQQVYGHNSEVAINNVNKMLDNFDKKLSMYKSNSDIDKINKNAGIVPVKVDNYTLELLKVSLEYSEKSNGIFDITIAPLSKLWGITDGNKAIPSVEEINKAKELVNYKNVIIDDENSTVYLSEKGMSIDLGGIAKGYICDEIKKEYSNQKITGAIVSIGGNIFSYQKKPDGNEFNLGIRNPKKSESDIVGKLKITDKVVATSGAYERFFEKDGKIYHHILDIKSGYPCKSDLLSVTVISDNGGLSDFLSTTFFILGKEKTLEHINDENIEIIIIDKEKNIYISDSLKEKFVLQDNDYFLKEGA